ncbi:MAG: polyprenyl synthetase family protein [Bacteroidales bacterium]|jgi:geranylgeranyl diphosphate synthase type II|nr:polyprenyl synthetase family protein [Bacteroidales bacterium]
MFESDKLLDRINYEIRIRSEKFKTMQPAGLYSPVCYMLEMGGKRLRPMLLLNSYNLFSDSIDEAMPAALAIEVFHNFTLSHDDIMDKAELRRNRLTVHKQYSENSAILSGDVMAFLAYEFLMECNSEKIIDIIRLFTKTAVEICEGQQLDIDFENRFNVTEEEYIEMIRLKTAVLLACCLKSGAMLAGAPCKIVEQLYELGINIGLAFQLQDDLLDTFGNQEIFGKKIGGDILANKKTFLLVKALELSQPSVYKELMYWINNVSCIPEEKIKAVHDIFLKLNIREIAENKIYHYCRKSINVIEKIELDKTLKFHLESLIDNMLKRNI